MSSTGLSSPHITSSAISFGTSFSSWLKRRRKSNDNLGHTVKVLNAAIKQYEYALIAQKHAAEAVKAWGATLPDENSQELISNLYSTTNTLRSLDPLTTVRVRTIIAKLEALKQEEDIKNRLTKELLNAERVYYKALYKRYPKIEVDSLERDCHSLRQRTLSAKRSYRNSMVLTIHQCFEIFFEHISMSCDATKQCCTSALNLLANFDTSPRDVFSSDEEDIDDNAVGDDQSQFSSSSSDSETPFYRFTEEHNKENKAIRPPATNEQAKFFDSKPLGVISPQDIPDSAASLLFYGEEPTPSPSSSPVQPLSLSGSKAWHTPASSMDIAKSPLGCANSHFDPPNI